MTEITIKELKERLEKFSEDTILILDAAAFNNGVGEGWLVTKDTEEIILSTDDD